MKPGILLWLALLFFSTTLLAQEPWERLPDNGLRNFGIIIPVGQELLGISTDRTYFRSKDMGLTWKEESKPQQMILDTAYILYPSVSYGSNIYLHCYRANTTSPDYVYLLRSFDEGQTWEKIVLGGYYKYVTDIVPYSEGVFISMTGATLRIRNDSQKIDTIGPQSTKLAYSQGRLWRLFDNRLNYSTDEGSTWLNLPYMQVKDFTVKGDTLCAYRFDHPAQFARSVDVGQTWTKISDNAPYELFADEHGFYQKLSTLLLFSRDGFTTTDTVFRGPYHKLTTFYNHHDTLFLCTESGLFRTTDYGKNWMFLWQGIPSENLDLSPVMNCCEFLHTTDDGLISVFGAATTSDGGLSWDANPNLPYFHQLIRKDDTYFAQSGGNLYRAPVGASPQWVRVNGTVPGDRELFALQGDLISIYFNFGIFQYLYRSVDNGLNWNEESRTDTIEKFFVMDDSLFGFQSNPFKFYKSEDLGKSWVVRGKLFPAAEGLYRQAVYYGDKIFLLNAGQFLLSEDRGFTWKSLYFPFKPSNGYLDIKAAAVNELGLFMLAHKAYEDAIFLSPDYGVNWINISQNLPATIFEGMAFIDSTLFVMEQNGIVWKRTDFSFVFDSLRGTVYYDVNANNAQDLGESGLPNVMLTTASDQNQVVTNSTGYYELFYGIVPDTVWAVKPSPHAKIEPPFHLLQSNSAFQDFAVSIPDGIRDMRLSITNASYFLVGYPTEVFVRIQNLGTFPASGNVQITLDPRLEFLGSLPQPTQVNGQQITLPLSPNIFSLKDRYLHLLVKTRLNTSFGDTITVSGQVNWAFGNLDLTPSDNSAVLRDLVYSAYDPNDKSVAPGYYSTDSLAARVPLDYVIRFQNTGNAPATTVILLDTISSGLDLASFEMLAASHPVQLRFLPGRVLEFRFDDIQLPDSTADQTGSHGFVRYRLTPRMDLVAGDTVRNTAYIYFDFNEPVITNTVETIIDFTSGTKSPDRHSFRIYPVPARTNIICEKKSEESGRFQLVNIAGQTVRTILTNGKRAELDLQGILSGVYFAVWLLDSGVTLSGKVMVGN